MTWQALAVDQRFRLTALPLKSLASQLTRLLNPHHDAFAISLVIVNCLTKIVLNYNGSSCNILFLDALREIEISKSSIVHRSTILIGFSGEHKSILGEIVFPVYVEGVNLPTKFLVMDCPSAYNAILRRHWIHEMEAMPSTYHQVLQFLTK